MHRPLLPLAVAAALATATCGASPKPDLAELRSVDDLRSAFETDAGTPRLVLLLSPT